MQPRPPLDESGPSPRYNSKPKNFQEMEEFGPNAPYWRWNHDQFARNSGDDCGPTAVAHAINMTIWSHGSTETVNVGDAISECVANGAYIEGDQTQSIPKLGDVITNLTGMDVSYHTELSSDPKPPLSWQQALSLARTRWLIVNKPGHIAAAVADRSGADCLWLMQGHIGGGFDGEDGDGRITEATWQQWRWQTLHADEALWTAPGVQQPTVPVTPVTPPPPPLDTSIGRPQRLWGQQAVWLWDLRHFTQSPAKIADKIASQGYDAVYMKASDGGRRWSHQWNRDTIQLFRDRGLTVAGWHYTYGFHEDSEGPAAEAAAVLWAANVYPEISHILDVEYEWLPVHQQRDGAAEAFFDALGVHDRLEGLAYCPDFRIAFRNQWPHHREVFPDGGDFPWDAFNRRCAAVFPMNYFHAFQLSPREGAFNLTDAWRRGFPDAPPVYPIYDQGPRLQEALELGRAQGYPTQSVWAFSPTQSPLSRPVAPPSPVAQPVFSSPRMGVIAGARRGMSSSTAVLEPEAPGQVESTGMSSAAGNGYTNGAARPGPRMTAAGDRNGSVGAEVVESVLRRK